MHKQPLIPPATINGLARSWIGQPRYTAGNTLQAHPNSRSGSQRALARESLSDH
jgi:hypothetical protein